MARRGPVLEITDGTYQNTVNLISPGKGYHLCAWNPRRPEITVFDDKNWFSGEISPVTMVLNPVAEAFVFTANSATQDDLIALTAKFNRVLLMAIKFWAGDRNIKRPFYLRAKAKGESYERYAVIVGATLHDSSNPFAAPFASRNPADNDVAVSIMRNDWMDCEPGNAKEIIDKLSTTMTSDRHSGIVFGPRDTGPNYLKEVPIANYYSQANISHIFRGNTLVNLVSFSEPWTPYAIFDPADGYTYFGSALPSGGMASDHVKFHNIMFNLDPEDDEGSGSAIWEYMVSDGVWDTLPNVRGEYIHLQKSGMVSWDIPDPGIGKTAWAPGFVNSIEGYWVRLSGLNEARIQVDYKPYSASWPYVDIKNDNGGDAGSKFDLAFYNPLEDSPVYDIDAPNRMFIGAREKNGIDEDIVNYINPSNSLYDGIEWTSAGSTTVVANNLSYYGYSADTAVAYGPNTLPITIGTIKFNFLKAESYAGRYRAFIRVNCTGSHVDRGEINFWLRIWNAGGIDDNSLQITRKVSDSINPNYITLIDLGSITLGPDKTKRFGIAGTQLEQTVGVAFSIPGANSGDAGTLRFYDLILIPQDVWYADVFFSNSLVDHVHELVIGSASPPSRISSFVRDTEDNVYQTPVITPGRPLSLFTNNDLRFFFLSAYDYRTLSDPDNPVWVPPPETPITPRLTSNFHHYFSNGSFKQANLFLAGRGSQGFIPE